MSIELHERKTWPQSQELNCHGFQTVALMERGKKFTVCSGQSAGYDNYLQPGGYYDNLELEYVSNDVTVGSQSLPTTSGFF